MGRRAPTHISAEAERSEFPSADLPEDWETAEFYDAILKKRPRVGKIKSSDYLSSGRFSIIDQGQQFIAGYSDDASGLYNGLLPVIVFGDHTRIFKYVDFPFLAGADGTQILLPNSQEFDPQFLYFALISLNIPSRGYNRHFSLLKQKRLPKPPLPEQRTIAHVLRRVQRAKEATENVIAAARQLKESLMRHLFTYGPVPFDQADQVELKETQIGMMPRHWQDKLLVDIATLQRGKDLPVKERQVGLYPVIGSNGVVGFHSEYVVNGPGVTVGRSGSVGQVTWIDSAHWPLNTTLWVKDFHGNFPKFVYFLLHRVDFAKYAAGVSVPTLNRNLVHPLTIAVPELIEQRKIADALSEVDRKILIEESKLQAFGALFKSLLHHLMTGKVRVGDLFGADGGQPQM